MEAGAASENSNEISKLAEVIKNKSPKIVIFSGAGISTSSGIPDFRSADGLYKMIESTMELDNPTQVFNLEYFKSNPAPFFSIAKSFVSKTYNPTKAHCLIKLFHDKNLLWKNFTQNIDGLDSKAGVPDNKNIECHGHFREGHCISCNQSYTTDEMKKSLLEKGSITCTKCNTGLVKPDIIFFGENLPSKVFNSIQTISEANLAVVMGTSLAVSPFNMFTFMINPSAEIFVVNRDKSLMTDTLPGNPAKHHYIESTCDDFADNLASTLQWTDQLNEIYSQFH